jgi:flagellar motor switch protein FliM
MTPQTQQCIKEELQRTSLTLKAELGRTYITVLDLLNLEEGDVVRLDNSIHDSARLYVDDEHKFNGILGVKGKRNSFKVKSIIDNSGGYIDGK